eukprot:Awhi_evm1s13557
MNYDMLAERTSELLGSDVDNVSDESGYSSDSDDSSFLHSDWDDEVNSDCSTDNENFSHFNCDSHLPKHHQHETLNSSEIEDQTQSQAHSRNISNSHDQNGTPFICVSNDTQSVPLCEFTENNRLIITPSQKNVEPFFSSINQRQQGTTALSSSRPSEYLKVQLWEGSEIISAITAIIDSHITSHIPEYFQNDHHLPSSYFNKEPKECLDEQKITMDNLMGDEKFIDDIHYTANVDCMVHNENVDMQVDSDYLLSTNNQDLQNEDKVLNNSTNVDCFHQDNHFTIHDSNPTTCNLDMDVDADMDNNNTYTDIPETPTLLKQLLPWTIQLFAQQTVTPASPFHVPPQRNEVYHYTDDIHVENNKKYFNYFDNFH